MVQEKFLTWFLRLDDEDTFTVKCIGIIMLKLEHRHTPTDEQPAGRERPVRAGRHRGRRRDLSDRRTVRLGAGQHQPDFKLSIPYHRQLG